MFSASSNVYFFIFLFTFLKDGQLWDRYIWEGEVANVETYDNTNLEQTKAVFVPGIGCTINSVLDMHNVESTHGSTYDNAGLHRSKDPGIGAFTPYHSTHTIATEFITAGTEIFAAYGDTWIPDIPNAQVTFHHNLEAAESFLQDEYYPFVVQIQQKHKQEQEQQQQKLKSTVLEGLWNFTRDFPVQLNQIFTVLPRNVEWNQIQTKLEEFVGAEVVEVDQNENNLKNEVDNNDDDLVATNGGDENDDGPELFNLDKMVTRYFIREQSKKSLEWLQRYGRCCDHIRPGQSTIPQAGRGAFANRFLPKGTIVAYSPLIHVGVEGDKLFTVPYEANSIHEGRGENYKIKDLIINYSFQHRDSTITLTPYGSMVNYINHASDGRKPNVKVVWPDEEMVAHKPDFLERNITTIRYTLDKIGLSFDYIALRDIQEGEEILMDYGPAWEAAWKKHVEEWKPLEGADEYVHSTEWPKDEPLRTIKELEHNPYPDNLETMCVESYVTDPRGGLRWLPVLRPSKERVPCDVLERHESPFNSNAMPTYRVELYLGPDDNDEAEHLDGEEILLEVDHVPHNEIFLTDRVKTADWHMPNVFRHPIAVPDEIMPAIWKNKKRIAQVSPKKRPAASASTSMPAGARMEEL